MTALILALLTGCPNPDPVRDTSDIDTSDIDTSDIDTSDIDTSDVDTEPDTEPDTDSGCVDADADGFGAGCVSGPDCDDEDGAVWTTLSAWLDADGDGYSPDDAASEVCSDGTLPVGYALTALAGDCDDGDSALYEARSLYTDADGDSFRSNAPTQVVCTDGTVPEGFEADRTALDCDDADATVWQTGRGYVDADGDDRTVGGEVEICFGDGFPDGYAPTNSIPSDCDDADATVWDEVTGFEDPDDDGRSDGIQQSACTDGTLPTGWVAESLGADCAPQDDTRWRSWFVYGDADGDDYGTGGNPTGVCGNETEPEGYVQTPLGTDCDDDDDTVYQDLLGAADPDGDGWVGLTDPVLRVCSGETLPDGFLAPGEELGVDCAPQDPARFSPQTLYADDDEDGYTEGGPQTVCSGEVVPDGYLAEQTEEDCAPGDASRFTTLAAYVDNDEDGYTGATTTNVCSGDSPPDGFFANPTDPIDCNDQLADRYTTRTFWNDGDQDGVSAGEPFDLCFSLESPVPTVYTEQPSDPEDCAPEDATRWVVETLYQDADLDGDATSASASVCIGDTTPPSYVSAPGSDCDDNDNRVGATSPEIPDNGIDDDCVDGDLLGASDPMGVYVDGDTSVCVDVRAANACSAATPCCSVDFALGQRTTTRRHFYVQADVPPEALDLASLNTLTRLHAVHVHGGYGDGWTRDVSVDRSVFTNVTTYTFDAQAVDPVHVFTGITSPTVKISDRAVMRHVTVQMDPPDSAGPSIAERRYGIEVNGTLDLRDSQLFLEGNDQGPESGGVVCTGIFLAINAKARIDNLTLRSELGCWAAVGIRADPQAILSLTHSYVQVRGRTGAAAVSVAGGSFLAHNALVVGDGIQGNENGGTAIVHAQRDLYAVNNLTWAANNWTAPHAYVGTPYANYYWKVFLQDNQFSAPTFGGNLGSFGQVDFEDYSDVPAFEAAIDALWGTGTNDPMVATGTVHVAPQWVDSTGGDLRLIDGTEAVGSAGSVTEALLGWLDTTWQVFDHTWVGSDPYGLPSGFAGANRGPDQRDPAPAP